MVTLAAANLVFSFVIWGLALKNSVNQCVHWFTGIKAAISVLTLIYGIVVL